MADISSIETTVLQGHVLRHVHELAKLRGLRGWGVKSGGHVGQKGAGANMSVDVDPIIYYLDGVETEAETTTNVVVEAADATNPRIDVLYISSAGVMTIAKGTAHAVTPSGEVTWQKFQLPCTPDMSAIEGVILAEIYVPTGVTSIVDAYVRMLGVPVSISSGGGGTGDVIGPATNTDANIPQWDGADSKTLKDGLTLSTSIGTPGVDTKVPTEKAVRSAIPPIVTTIGATGSDTNVPSEQAVREELDAKGDVSGPGSSTDGDFAQFDGTDGKTLKGGLAKVTSVGDPGSDSSIPTEQAVREALDEVSGGGGASFWTTFPGTPTRVSDTSFSVTDTGNANLYGKMFGPGTIIKWEKSGGGFQAAKIVSASYASNTVTYVIVGNTLATGFTDFKYCIHQALQMVIRAPGTCPLAALTGIDYIHASHDIYIFSAQVKYLTAPTTTGGVWDINDDGTSIFTTKPPIAAASKVGTETVCNCLLSDATTAVAKDSEISLDYDSGHATTPGADAYMYIWYMPVSWRYRA